MARAGQHLKAFQTVWGAGDGVAKATGTRGHQVIVKVGAGLGLRYITPFGPLRVDAAVPLNRDESDPRFGIYAGIGQAF